MAGGEGLHADAQTSPQEHGDTLAAEEDDVGLVGKDMAALTDERLQEKVEQLLASTVERLHSAFDIQRASMGAELKSCREKMEALEAEKTEMQQNVRLLQEQIGSLQALIFAGHVPGGWPMPNDMSKAGGMVNAGMRGPFSTLPSGTSLPTIPSFPWGLDGQASEPSTMAPPSPLLTPSAPPTPLQHHAGPPSVPPPPPPPGLAGLQNLLTPLPFDTPKMAPCHLSRPPGLEASSLDELLPTELPVKSAAISLSDAIEATDKSKPPLEEKAPQTLEDHEQQALKFMQSHKDTTDDIGKFGSPQTTPKTMQFLSPGRFRSPGEASAEFLSPTVQRSGQLRGTPSRTGLNLTPKLAMPPRATRINTPGLRSPAIPPSPFVICEGGGAVFQFTIRKADDVGLGVDFTESNEGSCLQVTAVKPGAMQAWNKLCQGGPAAGKAVMSGDRIVKVNEATSTKDMRLECEHQKLLKFTVQRGEIDDDVDPLSLDSSKRNRGVTT